MSCIDYGALLKVDGKFLNKNRGLFAEISDTGYVCEKATYNGKEYNIKDNYYVYAGDEDFQVVFYKNIFNVISKNQILLSENIGNILGEEFFVSGYPSIKVEHLDKTAYFDGDFWSFDEDDRKYYIRRYGYKKAQKYFYRRAKSLYLRKHGHGYFRKYLSSRYYATWNYNGHKYEVIFGYGIEPDEDVWNRIKNNYYGFSEVERTKIDEWFGGKIC